MGKTRRSGSDGRPLTATCEEFHRAGFLIEQPLKPVPPGRWPGRYPQDYARLESAPAFIVFRLVAGPRAEPRAVWLGLWHSQCVREADLVAETSAGWLQRRRSQQTPA